MRLALALLLLLPGMALASGPTSPARIALIIDDLGDHWTLASRALALPGAVTYSVLPHTPYAQRIAEQAHASGREVMLHLPMEASGGADIGPGGLTVGMPAEAMRHTLLDNLSGVPHVSGINNHMGSLLTRNPSSMGVFMAVLAEHGGLFFVDSRTTAGSVAPVMAAEQGVAVTGRDVFIDHSREPSAIRAQLQRTLALALKTGNALAIAHPYAKTLNELERLLPRLAELGVELVPVSQLIEQRSPQLWQASLSPSPRAAKSSKR